MGLWILGVPQWINQITKVKRNTGLWFYYKIFGLHLTWLIYRCIVFIIWKISLSAKYHVWNLNIWHTTSVEETFLSFTILNICINLFNVCLLYNPRQSGYNLYLFLISFDIYHPFWNQGVAYKVNLQHIMFNSYLTSWWKGCRVPDNFIQNDCNYSHTPFWTIRVSQAQQ